MDKKSTTKIEHYIHQNDNETNEVLVLSPEDTHIKDSIIFLHGHQVGMRPGAWETPRYLSTLVTNGYKVIVPSILGYGKTTGNPDYCGPATLKAVYESVKDFAKDPVHVVGASRGGTLAVLFAEKYPLLTRTCTSIAGAYDLQKLLNTTEDQFLKQNLLKEVGENVEDLKLRNPRDAWQNITMPIHIVHGEKDEQIPKEQAESFSTFLTEKGVEVQLSTIKNAGHKLFSKDVFNNTIIPFFTT